MTSHSNRAIQAGDVSDIDAMAAYLPYCDAFATDKLVANVARSLSIEHVYSCKLYDASAKGVAALIEHVRGLRTV